MLRIKTGLALGAASFALFTSANLPTVTPPTAPRATGYTYEMVAKSTSSSPMAGPGSGMTSTGIVGPDGSMRMDITSVEGASSAMSAVGDYYIMKDNKLLLVRPGTKTYIDIGDLAMSALASMPPQMLAQMTITGVTATSENVPGAEAIDGRPTEHLRTTIAYNMGIMGQSLPTTIVTDYWLVKLAVPMINPMAGMKNALASGPMAELVNKQIEVAPTAANGVAVKAIITQTLSAMGQSIVSTTTTEMKNLKEGNVDVSKIVLPEGYTKATK